MAAVFKNKMKLHCKKTLTSVLFILILVSVKTTQGEPSSNPSNISLNAENFDNSKPYFEGYNMYILEREQAEGGLIIDRKILLTDLENNIIREKSIPTNIATADILFYNTTTLLFGDVGGTKLWNFESDETIDLGFGGHHDIEINYLNDTFLTLYFYTIEIESYRYVFDNITEYHLNGTFIRSFDTRNYVDTWQLCPFLDLGAGSVDITHANSVCFDEDEQMIYLNVRNTNTFYKIDYNTGELIWGLGEYGNFTMYDIYGKERDHLFFHGHSLEKIAENKFLLFDNDFHNQTDVLNKESRYLEITINEDTMTANTTREWVGPEEYFSQIWGDCDLLPNNNLFGVFGYTQHLGHQTGSKLVEVNEKGEIVWLLESPLDEEIVYTIYKVERFRFTPIVANPTLTTTNNISHFEWDVWYNYKAKTDFDGEYYIYIDGLLVESGEIIFPKYWQSTKIEYTAEGLNNGRHEISLIVWDGQGHFSNESLFYTGVFEFRIGQNLALILGVSLGAGIPIIATSTIFVRKLMLKRM